MVNSGLFIFVEKIYMRFYITGSRVTAILATASPREPYFTDNPSIFRLCIGKRWFEYKSVYYRIRLVR